LNKSINRRNQPQSRWRVFLELRGYSWFSTWIRRNKNTLYRFLHWWWSFPSWNYSRNWTLKYQYEQGDSFIEDLIEYSYSDEYSFTDEEDEEKLIHLKMRLFIHH